jgi:hypothetical protein
MWLLPAWLLLAHLSVPETCIYLPYTSPDWRHIDTAMILYRPGDWKAGLEWSRRPHVTFGYGLSTGGYGIGVGTLAPLAQYEPPTWRLHDLWLWRGGALPAAVARERER